MIDRNFGSCYKFFEFVPQAQEAIMVAPKRGIREIVFVFAGPTYQNPNGENILTPETKDRISTALKYCRKYADNIAGVIFVGGNHPVEGHESVAEAMAARMRVAIADIALRDLIHVLPRSSSTIENVREGLDEILKRYGPVCIVFVSDAMHLKRAKITVQAWMQRNRTQFDTNWIPSNPRTSFSARMTEHLYLLLTQLDPLGTRGVSRVGLSLRKILRRLRWSNASTL